MGKKNIIISNPVRDKSLSGANGVEKKSNKISNGVSYKLFFKKAIFLIFVGIFCLNILAVSAADGEDKGGSVGSLLHEAGNAARYNTSGVEEGGITTFSIAGGIIKIFLSILSIIFILLMLYGGYLWMTARGNQEQVTKAKELITSAVIGLIIVIAAYAITYFVLYMLAKEYVQDSGF